MIVTKNSPIEDIVVGSIEQIANNFFKEEEQIIEMILSGEAETNIVDMGIAYSLFLIMLEEAYEITEEQFMDSIKDFENTEIIIDSLDREVFCVENVDIRVDPYGDIQVLFHIDSVV